MIQHQRITPGRPQENGRHERMHRTLKAETTRPPDWDLRGQQERFDTFRGEFNQERPHEALAQRTPGSFYVAGSRPLPPRLPEPEYSGHLYVRRVSPRGSIRFSARPLFLSEVPAGEYVGLEEVDDGLWSVFFYDVLLGRFSVRDWQLVVDDATEPPLRALPGVTRLRSCSRGAMERPGGRRSRWSKPSRSRWCSLHRMAPFEVFKGASEV